MTKRGFAEVSGHHLEQKKLKKKVEDHSMCDAERLESNEAIVKKDGSTICVNAVLASTTNSLSSDCLPVEDVSEKKYSVYEESSSEVFESQNDLKSTILKQQSTSMKRRKDIFSDFSVCCSEETVCGEPSSAGCYPDNNENSVLSKITGDALTVQNSINGEKSLHSYLTDGLLIQANAAGKDVTGMAINYTSYSAEFVKQHMIDSMPILNECDNDNNSETKSRKMIQATATEKVNSAIHKENISACTISPAISIEITQKVVSGNFKGELSLPPSPITGVVDSFVDKPNPNNNYLNSLNVEETAFSFQLPNKILCKEIPNIETAFEMQGRLGKVAESHDCFQNLTEQNVVSIGIHGDRITQEKEGIASFSSSSISEDDSILKLREKEVQGAFPMLSERSITSCNRKKLLVLDLNGLLCDIVNDYTSYRGEKRIGGKPIFKRPFCDDFLKFCFDNFDIGIWSSRRKYNVDSALDYLMGEFKHKLLFCWDQSKCTYTGLKTLENQYKPLVLKELKKLWNKEESDLPWEKGEFSPSNTLLLDDSPYKALLNPPHTAIFPNPYQYNDEEDRSLGPGGDVRVYLENLLMADNVQHYVEEHPFGQPPITTSDQHWNFYCDIIKRHATPSS